MFEATNDPLLQPYQIKRLTLKNRITDLKGHASRFVSS